MSELNKVINELLEFRDLRDWKQFHNPKDLSLALSIEASELLEQFLWKNAEDANKNKIKYELADIFTYGLLLANHYELDIPSIIREKMELNNQKYPVEKAKGTAKKYTDL